jgi:hypothetical protein
MTRDWKIGVCGVALVALVLLVYALFGRPAYPFFAMLRYTVAASIALGAWALYIENKRYLPLALVLLLLTGIHLFGGMGRSEWVKYDWSAAIALIVLAVILLVRACDSDDRLSELCP